MSGLVSVKTPPEAQTLRITIPDESRSQIRSTPDRSEPIIPKFHSPAKRRPPSSSRANPSRAKPSLDRSSGKKKSPEKPLLDEASLGNPDFGPFLLKLARDTIASGDGPTRALDYALRAEKSFERCAIDGEPNLDLAIYILKILVICVEN